jgi:hypothetical protein
MSSRANLPDTILPEEILPEEDLFRGVLRSVEHAFNVETGRPSSAVFKDPGGCSVDRDGGRDTHVILDSLSQNIRKEIIGAAVVNAGICLDAEICLIPKPSRKNSYHALMCGDPETKILKPAQFAVIGYSLKWIPLPNVS